MGSSAILLLIFLTGLAISANPDDSLPVYKRGLKWNEVEKHLKNDLRLSDAVVPLNYAIDLAVNVRGHAEAEKSDFNGTVSIDLDIKRAISSIELHSNGLAIEKAILVNKLIMSNDVEVSRISTNFERESISIYANRTIQNDEKFILQIWYRGVAKMDGYGLYENWDPKLNKTWDSNGPFILASNNFPTGARFWFPCFDDPKFNAPFQLQLNHPRGMNVYSNTNVRRTESRNDRTLTEFEPTRPLATYQVALSVNHLASKRIDVKGFGKVRLINSANSHDYYAYPFVEEDNLAKSWRVDIAAFLKRNLELLRNTTLEIPKEKLDIVILEGTSSLSVQPGLITVGRKNFWSIPYYDNLAFEIRNLAQILVGDQISLRHTEHAWLNELCSSVLIKETPAPQVYHHPLSYKIIFSSLHEKSLREQLSYPSTTKQYLTATNEMRSEKAAHIIRLLARVCPDSANAMMKYLTDHIGSYADIDDFIETVSEPCRDATSAREFLKDFIDQPGKAFLMVKRANNTVTITQTRYHTTYFDKNLRDNKTRYTIPIHFEIDGKNQSTIFSKNETSLILSVPDASFFLIDHEFDHLYFVFYEDPLIVPKRNYTDEEQMRMYSAIRKSMVAAYNMGYLYYVRIFEHVQKYVENRVVTSRYANYIVNSLSNYFSCAEQEHYDVVTGDTDRCDMSENWSFYFKLWRSNWDGLSNNETAYWQRPAFYSEIMSNKINCAAEWINSSSYQSFLAKNFLNENTAIRPDSMQYLASRIPSYHDHWRDLHRFFFQHVANTTDHRFNLLAHEVLTQGKGPDDRDSRYYPEKDIRKDYVKELREFVLRHPQRTASMSTEIEMKLEREYANCALPKWHQAGGRQYVSYDMVILNDIEEARKR